MRFTALLLLVSTLASGQGLINRRAPSFSLPDSNYTQHDILDYRGKWLLVSFMMTAETNCATCKDLARRLDAIQAKHVNKLNILGIVQTPQDTQETVKKFIADTKTRIPIVFDYSLVGIAYFKATPQRPAMDMPHIFAVNPGGTIVQDWAQPSLVGNTLAADVDKLLAGGSEPAKADPPAKAKSKK